MSLNMASVLAVFFRGGRSPSHTASCPFGFVTPLAVPADLTSAAMKNFGIEVDGPNLLRFSVLIYVFIKLVQK